MGRNAAIDLIRGLSILAVILGHLYIHLPFVNQWPQWIVNILFFGGYYGVRVFFVVSGFLIAQSIMNKWGGLPQVNLKRFYLMRFARIVPCLIALIVILSALDLFKAPGFTLVGATLPQTIFAALTFRLNNLVAELNGHIVGAWFVLWSLSVEEVFYLFFPLLCLIFKRERWLILVLGIFIVIGPFARVFGTNEGWQDYSYLSCMDGIAFGVLAALFVAKNPNLKSRGFVLSGLGLFVLIFCLRQVTYLLGLTKVGLNVTVLELGIALMLIALSPNTLRLRGTRFLQWYGRNSYEVYLTHMLVITVGAAIFKGISLVLPLYVLMIVISGLLGYAVAKYYSEPLNRWIRQ
ncbi:MAG: acyltransferase [Gammaproteobacteria bacterium]|nr:acyltransferase [Gammaproteobacteria bacterium]